MRKNMEAMFFMYCRYAGFRDYMYVYISTCFIRNGYNTFDL